MNNIQKFFEDIDTMETKKSFEAFTKCKGTIIFGAKKDLQNIIGTLTLIITLIVLYLIFIFPAARDYQYDALAIIIAIFSILPIITLLNVTMTEPGVLLRGDLPDPKLQQQQIKPEQISEQNQFTSEQYAQKNEPHQIVQIAESQNQLEQNPELPNIYTSRYCTTCKIMRPSKASHCKHCNHCVDGFDHHCFWVGTCIGIRNWRAFLIFLQSSLIVITLTLCQCLLNLSKQYLDIYELWILMFKQASIPLISLYGLYFICGCWSHQTYLNVIILMVMFLLPIIYSAVLMDIENAYKDYRYYQNPFVTILITIAMLLFFLFLLPVNGVNCYYISIGKTAKQTHSEDQFYNRIRQFDKPKYTVSGVFRNLLYFYTYPIPQSRNQQ
ncbi:unnamed protein product (macronuclear) [Paramecium tetraurelia]|uniref:Palmitoyltransferase n=1 Tax=Paramecium tetraurelia TaxID=5888 RepID=A0DGS4_PARTE|nr:uncharacterized protein GSPATT00002370001 [Paramecium tetraurelia]CAK82241.1 unnamed protein product [Paramecium tetraurelia]|eukprot:XP_001449638.1 hypothetical protein (macronuclear) [Paramecium tetraurelia strain d4-2]